MNANEELAKQFRLETSEENTEGTRESLERCARMLNTYAPDLFPANENGQVHFARAMMESVADEITKFLQVGSGNPHQQLTMQELTERFYVVKAQRDKLMWRLSGICDMANDDLRRGGMVDGTNLYQIEADARATLDEVRGPLASDTEAFRRAAETEAETPITAGFAPMTDEAIGQRLHEKNRFYRHALESQERLRIATKLYARARKISVDEATDNINDAYLNRIEAENQSYDDLAASGGIVDAP